MQKAAAGGAAAARRDARRALGHARPDRVQNAQPGALATLTVANRSAAPLTVTVTPRPWLQAVTGKVSPNRGNDAPRRDRQQRTFTLTPGAETKVMATPSTRCPRRGRLYGAMEVVGLPTDVATRKGVVLGYRVVGAIRLLPAPPKAAITAAPIKPSKGTAVLPVKNAGNTVDAVTGRSRSRTARGTKNLTVAAVKILPGKTVNIPLGTKLVKGSATAKVTLNQRGKKALHTDQEVQGQVMNRDSRPFRVVWLRSTRPVGA